MRGHKRNRTYRVSRIEELLLGSSAIDDGRSMPRLRQVGGQVVPPTEKDIQTSRQYLVPLDNTIVFSL